MIKSLITNQGIAVNAMYTVAEDLKRGTFVKISGGKLVKATTLAEAQGFLVRDVKVTDDVAQGLPVSDWSLEQDVVVKDEFAGIRPLVAMEEWALEINGIADADLVSGKYLDVANGALVKATATTKLLSLGKTQVAGHDMVAVRVLA